MKNFIRILSAIGICALTYSCTTYQKVTILGKPGSEIYTPNMEKVGTIQDDGKTKVTLPRDGYYAYLLSHEADSKELIPFALDYENKSYTGARALAGLCYTVLGASLICDIGGLAAILGKDEDVGAPLLSTGLIGGLVGTFSGMTMDCRLQETQRKYQFKYLSSQRINNDLQLTDFIDNGVRKELVSTQGTDNKPNIAAKDSVSTNSTITPSSSARPRSSKSSKSLKDYGKQVAGTYVGTGKLLLNDNVVENYQGIKVVIKRIDKKSVEVEVFESSGESFFNNASNYSITKDGETFNLSLNGIPSAIITVDKNNNVAYYHPKVNIDGDIYTLEISATK